MSFEGRKRKERIEIETFTRRERHGFTVVHERHTKRRLLYFDRFTAQTPLIVVFYKRVQAVRKFPRAGILALCDTDGSVISGTWIYDIQPLMIWYSPVILVYLYGKA